MAIITEKTDYLCEVKYKYTYRIFTNGNGDISVEVQLTRDFEEASMKNYAIATMSKEDFDTRMGVDEINNLFFMLRRNISPYGRCFELDGKCYRFTEV